MKMTLSEERRRRLVFLLETRVNRRREVLPLPEKNGDTRELINLAIGAVCLAAMFIILNIAN